MKGVISFVLAFSLLLSHSAANAQVPDDSGTIISHSSFSMSKGRLGVLVQSMTPELRAYFGAPEDRGLLIARVESDTPAERAGFEVGDVITAVNGQEVGATTALIEQLNQVAKGEHASVTVVRDKVSLVLDVTLDSDPLPELAMPGLGAFGPDMKGFDHFGMKMLEKERERMLRLFEDGDKNDDKGDKLQLWPPVDTSSTKT